MMYICSRCGHQFEDGEERHVKEYMGECHGSPAVVEYSVCPICGCDEYEMADRCTQCNLYSLDVEDGLCKKCAGDLQKKFDDFYTDLSIEEKIYFHKNFEYMAI